MILVIQRTLLQQDHFNRQQLTSGRYLKMDDNINNMMNNINNMMNNINNMMNNINNMMNNINNNHMKY